MWRPRKSNPRRQEHCKCSPQPIAAPIVILFGAEGETRTHEGLLRRLTKPF